MNHSNSFTNLNNKNLSIHSQSNNNINNKLKEKFMKSKSISKFHLKKNSIINKTKSKPKQIQIPKCNNKKKIILNIKIGKKNTENYTIDKTPLKTNHKLASKINNYYSYTQSYNNLNKIKGQNAQSCININKEFLFDKFNDKKNKNSINNNINDLNYIFNDNKYLENSNIQSIKNLKIDTELNKYIINLNNKDYQTFNGSITESPVTIKIFNNKNNKNNINYSDINYFYNNNFIYNTNNISDTDIIKHFNNLSNTKNKKDIIPNNFSNNKYLQSTYEKISSFFNNINSTRNNSINVNVFQNINNNNKNNLNKYNHLIYNSSQNIGNNSSFSLLNNLNKKNSNSSINIIKTRKKRKNKSVEIIDKINFNIKNINISNNFIKKIDNIKLIKPNYQIKLDIIKRRTINMLEFYINLAKNAVDKSINNNHN